MLGKCLLALPAACEKAGHLCANQSPSVFICVLSFMLTCALRSAGKIFMRNPPLPCSSSCYSACLLAPCGACDGWGWGIEVCVSLPSNQHNPRFSPALKPFCLTQLSPANMLNLRASVLGSPQKRQNNPPQPTATTIPHMHASTAQKCPIIVIC
mgnify:CR=1 FL=1